MQIDRSGSVKAGAIARSTRSSPARGGDFARRLEKGQGGGAASAVSGTLPLGSIEALLAMQGVDDSTSGKARRLGRMRAEDLLRGLEDIRAGLLAGVLPPQQLETLLGRLKDRIIPPPDPLLAELLAEIELRASVELAKLEAF
ncbi:MAG: flagellar assembly protein FliX [Alphaproteobacteria bacterium]|nr:flagellar assembly protein FliX [Alphaproteobacteria bacterium]